MTDEEMRQLTRQIIRQVEDENDADVFAYFGPVSIRSERAFNECLRKHRESNSERKNIFCVVATYGGSADVAYQLARAAKRHYPDGKLIVFVDSVCKSAGTLLAIGADEIVMSDTAELGPLDVQLQKPEEMGELMSGLVSGQALDTLQEAALQTFEAAFLRLRFRSQLSIGTRTAADMAVKLAVGLFDPIYAHFDPWRLGEHERSVQIALAYGNRIKTSNVKDDTINQLVAGYPSHGFVIDRDEAKSLFRTVRVPSEAENFLGDIFRGVSSSALEGDSPVIRRLDSDEHRSTAEENENRAADRAAGQDGRQNAQTASQNAHHNGEAARDGSTTETHTSDSAN